MSETATFQATAAVYTQWELWGIASTFLEAIGSPTTYGAKTLNTDFGNKIGGTLNSALLPATMTGISVEVQAVFFNTAVTSGRYRWFVELAGQFTYSANYKPNGTEAIKYSGTLARPGGGDWTRADLTTVKFGIEGNGDGPWNGEEGSGGEGRMYDLRLKVVYTSAAAPVAEFIGAPREIFAGDSVTFTDSSVNTPTSWVWSFGDTTTATSSSPTTHTYTTQPAPYPNNSVTVSLEVANTGGTDTETKTNYVDIWLTTDPITAQFAGSPVSGNYPLAVTFTESAIGKVDGWTWAFGDTATSTSSAPTHTYTTVGTYTVTLTASNAYTTDSEVKTSYIEVLDPRPSPDFTGSPLSGVRPLTVVFTATEGSGNEVTAYSWNFGDSNTSILENPSHAYVAAGTYTVTLSMANAYGTVSTSKTNYVSVSPQTASASFQANNVFGYSPVVIRFSDQSSGDVSSWNWSFGDTTTATSSLQNPVHLYRTAGVYTVTLVVNSATTANSSTLARASYITVTDALSYGRFLDDLGKMLLEHDELSPCEMFTDFGGASNVLNLVYDRVCRFQLETGALKKEATLSRDSGDVYSLPSDLIELRRLEVDGLRVEPIDHRALDLSNAAWQSTAGACMGYIQEPSTEGLKVTLVPTQAAERVVKALYVYAPTRPSFQSPCENATDVWDTFPLPYAFWWVIRFGVLADILKQEGDMYDPARAAKCEEQWAYGVDLVKSLLNTSGGQD